MSQPKKASFPLVLSIFGMLVIIAVGVSIIMSQPPTKQAKAGFDQTSLPSEKKQEVNVDKSGESDSKNATEPDSNQSPKTDDTHKLLTDEDILRDTQLNEPGN